MLRLKGRRELPEDRIDTNSKGVWIPRGFRVGDIVKIRSHLHLTQPDLFPPTGLCLILKVIDGIFSYNCSDEFLILYDSKRGKFKIDSSCCTIIIEGYYDPG